MRGKEEAISVFNDLGKRGIPFFFLADFDLEDIRISIPGNVSDPDIKYRFHQKEIVGGGKDKKGGIEFTPLPVPYAEYLKSFNEAHNNILTGNTFLINLTCETPLSTNLSIDDIYNYSSAPYMVLLKDKFVCFSPEPFIRIKDGLISAFPMKGTIKASVTNAGRTILESKKETAEHNTIVDLLRNDLSIVASSVEVTRFRYINRIVTNRGDILQVSSEISGTLQKNYNQNIGDIFFSLLPAGSVTGAPKIKTVEIIKEIEKTKRGFYTGVCGLFDGKDLDSGVMIRFIEKKDGTLIFRSGGGITFMSNPMEEYNELIDKVYVPFI